ncbi:TonB-dependent receptor domain-containing protein [Marinomonas posidonica]|uniref:TonB-dependent receptor plug n=1 Tax=Marinomonas posidonica (strain CECT 7376 / NCIMB 14433 / IVIA-Po-181) TaxID=491952 RepID=F6CZF4_MARPP|nr:TonB-dependent receptor [Marinomonas posidonica]AEF54691.1 TonB-dependent receptor plug [Marinomonas posidonica IVIA-Po-181]
MSKKSIMTMTVLAVAISNASFAEEQLDSLVITASGFEQDTAEAPASISVITAEDIEKGAYRDLADVIESVPGVQIARTTGGSNIQMRGLEPDYTLFLIDGRPQSSRDSREKTADGYDHEWMPPLSLIERIEVVRGPMSTLYGSSAMGGVINIITKKHTDEWHGNLHHEVISAEGSEFNNSKTSTIALSGPVIPNVLSAQLSVEYYDQEEDDIDDGNPEKEINSYNAKFNFLANKNHDFSVDLSKTEQNRIFTLNKSTTSSRTAGEQENEKESFALTHTGRYDDITENSFIQIDSTNNITDESKINNTQVSSSWVVPTENNTTTAGVSYINADLEDNGNQASSGLTELSNNQLSAFIEDEWYMTEKFSLITGLRADKNENFKNHLSPKVYGVFSINDSWTLKGGVSTGYKAPKLRQLSSDWAISSSGRDTYGNSDLKAESSVSSEISAIFNNNVLMASITVFDNQFEDKIERDDCTVDSCPSEATTTGSRLDRVWVNIDEAKTQGVEISSKLLVTKSVSTSLSYTYTDSEQLTGDNKGSPLTSVPLHMATASFDWSVNEKLKVWTSYTYYGEANEEDEPTPSYDLVDLGANYIINDNLKISLGMNNALDEEFTDEEYGFVDHGREYWVALDASF